MDYPVFPVLNSRYCRTIPSATSSKTLASPSSSALLRSIWWAVWSCTSRTLSLQASMLVARPPTVPTLAARQAALLCSLQSNMVINQMYYAKSAELTQGEFSHEDVSGATRLPRTYCSSALVSSSENTDKFFTTTCGKGILARTSK